MSGVATIAKAVRDPRKGDVISWSELRNGRRQTYSGKVQTVHPDRWLVMVGPGRLHSLAREDWEATGEITQPVPVRLALVTA